MMTLRKIKYRKNFYRNLLVFSLIEKQNSTSHSIYQDFFFILPFIQKIIQTNCTISDEISIRLQSAMYQNNSWKSIFDRGE